jgi:hypothetical protein
MGQAASPQGRIAESVASDKVVTLRGNVHPMARPANDRGLLADQQPITKMHILLARSAGQENALQQLMAQQLDPGSPSFHAWLTPQEFGDQFGPADSDIQAVKAWLTSQGFTGLKVNHGKTWIEFDGTAGQVRNAFRSEVHRLSVRGEEHFANMQEPQIPAALSSVVGGVTGLHNFRPKPLLHRLGKFRRDASSGQITPLFTFSDVNGTFYGVGPKDFATIYNVNPVYSGGIDGTGQTIAIVAQSNIDLKDVQDFRTIFGLAQNFTSANVILNGPDPGLVSGDEGESDLDVELSGGVAPGAKIMLVTSLLTDTDGGGGVDASAEYIVDNNVAPVLSDSYGSCESGLTAAGNQFYASLWQQAAAQGISVVVSAGDSGSAGCDNPNTATSASGGIAVSGIASTPYNVAMGGTDFDQAGIETTFWNSANDSSSQVSAKGYIPEITWNDSCANAGLSGCNSVSSTSASLNIVAGSGGPSSIYTKAQAPWQNGFGDAARDLPDVSLFASDGQNKSFYILCQSDADIPGDTGCNLTTFSGTAPFHDFQAVGGTSAAAPSFAAIIALVNQKTGQRQGNVNPTLYSMAKNEIFANCKSGGATDPACVFNDVVKGTISVPCPGASTNCSKTTSGGFGVLASGGTAAYTAVTGYDLASGLGSVNVANLLTKWATPGLISTSTTLASSPAPISGSVDSSFTLSGKVSKSSGSATPSGRVVFLNASTGLPADSTALDASGNYTLATTLLPAGTYTLKAHYGGDSAYAPSDSTAVSVNILKQASKVLVSFVNAAGTLVIGDQTVEYGSNYILRVDVENAAGTPCENANTRVVAFICPTGTVNLFDGSSALKDFPNAQTANATSVANLNDRGFIEDQPIQLGVGKHPITASYTAASGSSYTSQASSNSLSVTITQATTTTAATSSAISITSGGTVTLTAIVSSSSNSTQGPTGTVQFLNGGASLGTAATCNAAGATSSGGASCKATLTTTLSSLPPGIIDVRPPNSPFVFLTAAMALAMIAFLLSMKLSARRGPLVACTGAAFFLIAAAALAGCSAGSSGGGGGGGGGSARSITAKYSGDTNYAASTSSAITITVH